MFLKLKEIMRKELKSGIPEFDETVEKFENGEINFVKLVSDLWNKGYNAGKNDQYNLSTDSDKCPDCFDKGWIYNDYGQKAICPCHY